MRRPDTRERWEEETRWIEEEATKPFPIAQFAKYVKMQSRFCREDGLDDLSERIERCAVQENSDAHNYGV